MAPIERRKAAIAFLVQNILRTRTPTACDEHFRLVIDEFGVGVGTTQQEAMPKGTFDQELTRMIDRVTSVGACGNKPKVRIVKEWIEFLIYKQVFTAGTHISSSHDQSPWERALHVQVPLMRQRID